MARVLVKKDIAKAIMRGDGPAEAAEGVLPDGHKAGLYGIETRQNVRAQKWPDLPIWNYEGPETDLSIVGNAKATPPIPAPPPILRQTFQVQAPQFSIDPKNINTFYPPSGHQDEGRILPHIVFNDPHVPWLREAGVSYNFVSDPIDVGEKGSNLIPWMALVVFDPEELVITQDDAAAIGLMDGKTFESKVASYVPDKLPANGAFQMMVGEYFTKIEKNRIYYEAGYPNTSTGEKSQDLKDLEASVDMTSVIFPKKSLVKMIFGEKTTVDLVKDEEDRKFEGQKLMAHVRHVNTIGFPDAGVEEEGWFSVVVSSRTGSVHNNMPKTQVVHLVSLEHYDSSLVKAAAPFRALGDDDRVGLISLFSWSYTVIPAAVNFVDTMAAIAKDMQTLKPPKSTLKSMMDIVNPPADPLPPSIPKPKPQPSLQKAAQLLHDRLDLSYTMSRWRTATGEESVAFNRGPLVSAPTPKCPAKDKKSWPKLSMTGKDYQIFDKDIGVMDLTYSSAWSLGKLAAISDSPFNAALLRFRSLVWTKSASNTRLFLNGIKSTAEALANASNAVDSARNSTTAFAGAASRLSPTSTDSVAPPLTDKTVAPVFKKAVQLAVDRYASTVTGKSLYNDFHLEKAANSDWELIHAWICDTLYLAHIPAHYLFPEPSHTRAAPEPGKPTAPNLPPEALRFFYIDHSWLDAFLDGALSCANHLEPDYDSTRLRIKEVINYYLEDQIVGLKDRTPPVPQFGFVFRSSVVKAIPDLKIIVRCWLWKDTAYVVDKSTNPRNPVVRLTKLDDFTILCLLDCTPDEIYEIKISQPPHQQRYALGDYLGPNTVDAIINPSLEIRMMYTDKEKAPTGTGEDGEWKLLPANEQPDADTQKLFWKNDSRCINPTKLAEVINKKLTGSVKYANAYVEDVPTSALIGIELSDPAYALVIKPDTAPKVEKPYPKFVRQLWLGTTRDASPHETEGTLTQDMLPSGPLVKTTAIDPTKINVGPLTPASKIPDIPPPPRLNSSAITNSPPFTLTNKPGVGTIPGPQFTLIFHVDYRTPPPTPLLSNNKEVCYAPLDYLPTDTEFLYDIIIAIRRIAPRSNTTFLLQDISIEMPISDGTDAPDAKNQVREPLLPVGGYHGPGVHMVNNPRFVPTLYNTQDAAGKPVLGIKLIPRSGRHDATVKLIDDHRTNDLSIRLAEVPIAKIKKPLNSSIVQVTKDGKATTPPSIVKEKRGVVKLRLIERYLMPDGRILTQVTDGNSEPGAPQSPIPLMCLKKDVVSE